MDEKTDLTFKALFLLEDFRGILRETSPKHDFDDIIKRKAKDILDQLEKIIVKLKERL
jgi:hypothetical protein